MEVIKLGINDKLDIDARLVATLGQFDGIHIGHMKLIEQVKKIAHDEGFKTGLITFDPHPDFVLKKRDNFGYLSPLTEKLKMLSEYGIDYAIIIEFNVAMSQMSPEEFYDRYLSHLEALVVGSDFRFGYRGKGNVETLKALGKRIIAIEVVKYNDVKIGSNQIRDLLMNGKVDKISLLLNRYYNITGIVRHGSKVGRTLGIRTANVDLAEEYQLIKKGVYAVSVHIAAGTFLGVCNIGNNPTINYTEKMRLEVHIINYNGDLYNEEISIDFIERLRDEQHFSNVEEMVNQIHKDIEYVKEHYRGKI